MSEMYRGLVGSGLKAPNTRRPREQAWPFQSSLVEQARLVDQKRLALGGAECTGMRVRLHCPSRQGHCRISANACGAGARVPAVPTSFAM
jgi:hypothetical protein